MERDTRRAHMITEVEGNDIHPIVYSFYTNLFKTNIEVTWTMNDFWPLPDLTVLSTPRDLERPFQLKEVTEASVQMYGPVSRNFMKVT